jgi:uncharacterized protein YjgD (DUF1641 family)
VEDQDFSEITSKLVDRAEDGLIDMILRDILDLALKEEISSQTVNKVTSDLSSELIGTYSKDLEAGLSSHISDQASFLTVCYTANNTLKETVLSAEEELQDDVADYAVDTLIKMLF